VTVRNPDREVAVAEEAVVEADVVAAEEAVVAEAADVVVEATKHLKLVER
jgi:hypothetical protein